MSTTLGSARVAVVSGKGGVGKTTVAAALATAASRAGKRVLLAEIEDREGIAPLFGLPRLGYAERALAPNLAGLSVEADEALVEYLQLFYGVPRLSRALVRSKAVEFATHTAPGLRDILLIGKIKEAEQRRAAGRHVYDLIVLDAPPTGRLPRFLDAPRAVAELVRGGPIRRQAEGVLEMVSDPRRLQVVLVCQPEEMPVRETLDACETLSGMGVAVGPVVLNGMWPRIGKLGRSPRETLRAAAEDSGVLLVDEAVDALATVAAAHERRATNQRSARAVLDAEVRGEPVTLPYLFTERIGREELDVLASVLAEAL